MTNTTPEKKPPVVYRNITLTILCVISLVIAVAAIIVAVWGIKNQNLYINTLSQLQNSQQQLNLQQQQRQQTFEAEMNDRITKNADKIEQLTKQTINMPAELAKLQANALIQLAQLELQFSSNPLQAIQLLKFANQTLSHFNSQELDSLKNKINQDIQALQQVRSVNKAELLNAIDALMVQINQLPLAPSPINTTTSQKPTPPSRASGWWQNIKNNFAKLKNFVVIHKVNDASQLAISPDKNFLSKQSILIKLAQAQWAVLNSEPELFQLNLQQAQKLIQSLYLSPTTQQELNTKLMQLLAMPPSAKININLISAESSPSSPNPSKNGE